MAARSAVMAVYDDIHHVVAAVNALREQGLRDITVYGPVMEAELEEALGKPPSPVRRYTLVGGILGCVSGFALTIWSSYYYPLVVGGKALASIPAYVVIGFELTILFAGISALIGMLIHNRMPRVRLDPAYDEVFSDDRFGVRVVCAGDRTSSVEQTLRSTGSREVRVED
jgi:molybdopterin-containing oxidoreductase family membrane subunit